MRNLKTKEVVARFEGHLAQINALTFDSHDSYTFVSAANNECLVWNPKDII
jgi:WD40 repeat protein